MLLVLNKKSALKLKDFFSLSAYPTVVWEKRTLSEPCYCHVDEGLPGHPHQKAVQVHAQVAEDGPGEQGTDEILQADLQLQVSLVHYYLVNFFWIFFG